MNSTSTRGYGHPCRPAAVATLPDRRVGGRGRARRAAMASCGR